MPRQFITKAIVCHMNYITNTMDASTHISIFLTAGAAVITALVTVLWFVIKRFADNVTKLSQTVSDHTAELRSYNTGCYEKHTGINAQLKAHDDHIGELYKNSNKNTIEIEKLKTKAQ